MVGKLGGGVEFEENPDRHGFFGVTVGSRQTLDFDESNILAEDTFHPWMVGQTDKLVPLGGRVVFDRHVCGVEVGIIVGLTRLVGFGIFHGGKVV
jgi:hypothetical protein